jgi:hypothetical protein
MMGEWNSANGQLGEPQYKGNPTVLPNLLHIRFYTTFLLSSFYRVGAHIPGTLVDERKFCDFIFQSGACFGITSEVRHLFKSSSVDPSDLVNSFNCLAISRNDAKTIQT